MKKIISLIVFISVISTSFSAAQESVQAAASDDAAKITFSADRLSDNGSGEDETQYDEKKHPLIGIGGMLAFSALLYSYNRFICNAPWAQTGYSEYNKFWTRDIEWDDDWYWTNFVLHPYQGGLYYMAARGSNLNQLESFGVTVLGSAIWEYLCETNAPSKNDMVYTTLGAYAVGEMLYRLSQEGNEISRLLGVALNPQRLWTEYLWKVNQRPNTGNIYELSVGFSLGTAKSYTHLTDSAADAKIFALKDAKRSETFPVFGLVDIDIVYNDPYTQDSNIPYSQFDFFAQMGAGVGSNMGAECQYKVLDEKLFYNIQLLTSGSLISRAIQGEKTDTSFGLVFEYDFDWHSFYQLSSLAPGFAIRQRIRNDTNRVEWQAHFDGVILGTSDSYYSKRKFISSVYEKTSDEEAGAGEGTRRLYSYNTGFENVLKFRFVTDSGHALAMNFHGYALYDFRNQLKDNLDTGWELFGNLKGSYELPLSKTVRLGLSDEVYAKRTFFKHKDNYYQILNTAKLYAKLKLK